MFEYEGISDNGGIMFSNSKWMWTHNISQNHIRLVVYLTRDTKEEITDEMIQSCKEEYELRKSISKTDTENKRNSL